MRTSSNIIFNTLVSSLPIGSSNVGDGVVVTLSGWGTLLNGGEVSNNLQYIQLRTISDSACETALLPYPTFPSQICTYTDYGEGTCHGDAGGPLVVSNVLVGVVSYVRHPCAIGYPDVFARISSYVSWIQDTAT